MTAPTYEPPPWSRVDRGLDSVVTRIVHRVGDAHRDLLEVPSLNALAAFADELEQAAQDIRAWIADRIELIDRRRRQARAVEVDRAA